MNVEIEMILKSKDIIALIDALADQIIQDNKDHLSELVLIGIVTAGYPIANRLSTAISNKTNVDVKVGKLDVSLYRDDLLIRSDYVTMKESDIPFNITEKRLILVDDVLFQGRTIRAALNALLDFGRPSKIECAVLLDRKYVQLPIFAKYIGKVIDIDPAKVVRVKLLEIYGEEGVFVETKVEEKSTLG